VLGTAFGIIVGPHCANILNPRTWGSDNSIVTLEILRVVLATGLFTIGVELPEKYMAKHAKGLLVMVVPTMAFGWVVVAGMFTLDSYPHVLSNGSTFTAIIHGLFPNLGFISALAISACLTPTDPIICAAIVGTPMTSLPTSKRNLI